jgi:hypothetical protein
MTCCGSRRLCSPPQCAIRSSRAAVFQIRPEVSSSSAHRYAGRSKAPEPISNGSAIRSRSAPKFS